MDNTNDHELAELGLLSSSGVNRSQNDQKKSNGDADQKTMRGSSTTITTGLTVVPNPNPKIKYSSPTDKNQKSASSENILNNHNNSSNQSNHKKVDDEKRQAPHGRLTSSGSSKSFLFNSNNTNQHRKQSTGSNSNARPIIPSIKHSRGVFCILYGFMIYL